MPGKPNTNREQIGGESNTSFEPNNNKITTVTPNNTVVVIDRPTTSNHTTTTSPNSSPSTSVKKSSHNTTNNITINTTNGEKKLIGNSYPRDINEITNCCIHNGSHFVVDYDTTSNSYINSNNNTNNSVDDTLFEKQFQYIPNIDLHSVNNNNNNNNNMMMMMMITNELPTIYTPKNVDNSSTTTTTTTNTTFDCLDSLSSSMCQSKKYNMSTDTCFGSINDDYTCLDYQNLNFMCSNIESYTCVTPKLTSSIHNSKEFTTNPLPNNIQQNDTHNIINGDEFISQNNTIIMEKGINSSNSRETNSNSTVKYCGICDRKLALTNFKCKCGFYFCDRHRHAELHDCTFDYKNQKKDLLRKTIIPIYADKIRKI